MILTLHDLDYRTTPSAHYALGEAGLAESWETGDGNDIFVVLKPDDFNYMRPMIEELQGSGIRFTITNEDDINGQ